LAVADEFYILIRVAINKDKSKLLTNTTVKPDPISIDFGHLTIQIPSSSDLICFLGVSINIRLNQALIKRELKTHIRQYFNIVKSKLLTDRQFYYITNHILISQLLYKMRNIPLSADACNILNKPIRRLYKVKCSFSRIASNTIFHLPLFYNLVDL